MTDKELPELKELIIPPNYEHGETYPYRTGAYLFHTVKARETAIAERLKYIQSKTLLFGDRKEQAYFLIENLLKELTREK